MPDSPPQPGKPHPFAQAFADAWSAPTPDRLTAILTEDVELVQPLAPTTRGREAARLAFSRVLGFIPDLHAEVLDHWHEGDRVTIQFDLIGTVGGRPLRWHLVDVFDLRDGLGRRRISYFDPTPLLGAVLTRPRAWRPYARSGLWRRR